MWEVASLTIATLFATIGPIDVAAMFAALTAKDSPHKRRQTAIKAAVISSIVLLVFALLGEKILSSFGITLAALRTAGGILLFIIGVEMVFARDSGATSTTPNETEEAKHRNDIATFPLATPLIAGPGAIGAVILLMAEAKGDFMKQVVVVCCTLLMVGITLICLLAANRLQKFLGVTGTQVIGRIFGILLAALAVQFVFDGIKQSGIL